MKRFLTTLVLIPFFLFGAPPEAIWLTWQQDPTTTMTIQWLSEDVNDQVSFRPVNQPDWNSSQASHTALPDGFKGLVHRVELTQLKPDSSYEFKLADDTTSWRFRTMPANLDVPLQFIVGGDMYEGSLEDLHKTNREAAAKNPAFVVIGGDIAYSSSTFRLFKEDGARWIDWLHAWSDDLVSKDGFLIPIVPAIGNHEVNGRFGQTAEQAKFFFALFPMPNNRAYRSLDFGSYLTLILLDSGHASSVKGAQKEWLKQTLAAKKDFTHRFAVYHVPAYPSIRDKNNGYSKAVRDHWTPIFDQHHLHVAFEHHDHAYKRTYKIRHDKKDDKGTLYLGDGAWSPTVPRSRKKEPWYVKKALSARHFIIVSLQNNERRFLAVSDQDKVIDSYSEPAN